MDKSRLLFMQGRYPVSIHTLSDNTGTSWIQRFVFYTTAPMLTPVPLSIHDRYLDVSHIAGTRTELADSLSRLTDFNNLPPGIRPTIASDLS